VASWVPLIVAADGLPDFPAGGSGDVTGARAPTFEADALDDPGGWASTGFARGALAGTGRTDAGEAAVAAFAAGSGDGLAAAAVGVPARGAGWPDDDFRSTMTPVRLEATARRPDAHPDARARRPSLSRSA
jgi:hypothetical protein